MDIPMSPCCGQQLTVQKTRGSGTVLRCSKCRRDYGVTTGYTENKREVPVADLETSAESWATWPGAR